MKYDTKTYPIIQDIFPLERFFRLTKHLNNAIIRMSIQFAKTVPTKEYNAKYSDCDRLL